MFADIFIKRPVLSTVCSLLIILAGAISIPTLPIARYPELAPPAVSVTALYTGANAQTVESAVTTPLEQVINGVEGMTYLQSSSTSSGISTINVFFEVGRDPVPGLEQHHVADDELVGGDDRPPALASDRDLDGQEVAEALGGALRPFLLDEGEDAVDDDDLTRPHVHAVPPDWWARSPSYHKPRNRVTVPGMAPFVRFRQDFGWRSSLLRDIR